MQTATQGLQRAATVQAGIEHETNMEDSRVERDTEDPLGVWFGKEDSPVEAAPSSASKTGGLELTGKTTGETGFVQPAAGDPSGMIPLGASLFYDPATGMTRSSTTLERAARNTGPEFANEGA